jgi:hypothetical protein
MPIPTITETIARGDLSIGYAANNNAKGALFGSRLASPSSPVSIAMVTDALNWSTEGYYTDEQQREIANYLIWLTGSYGMDAAFRLGQTSGGGSLTPGGGGSGQFRYPLRVTGSDFESDGVTLNNSNIVGDNLMIFVSNFSQEWQFAPDFFVYTATGIEIVFPGFDANNYNQIIIDEYFGLNQ